MIFGRKSRPSGRPAGLARSCPARPVRSGPGRSGRGCRDGAGPGRSRIPCYKFLALLFFSERRQGPGRAAPGRPGLLYEPNQNGRKSGRRGLGRKMNDEKCHPTRERPPQIASEHFGEGGTHHGGRAAPAFRRKIPEKHPKTMISTPPLAAICAGKRRPRGACRVLALIF